MPESRSRKKADYTPLTTSKKPVRVGGARWIAPVMVACWVLGLAWIVTYYINPDLRYLRDLGDWNLLIGMGLIALGFVFSTKWE